MKPLIAKLSNSPQSSFKYKWIKLDSFEFNWHCHPEYEIMLMLRSNGKRFIGDNISFYQEGDLLFIGSNLPHTWYAPANPLQKHEAILIQFTGNMAGLSIDNAPEFKSIHRLLQRAKRGLRFNRNSTDALIEEIVRMNELNGLQRFLRLITILDKLAVIEQDQTEVLSSIKFANTLQPRQQTRIDRVCTYLNQHYKNDIRLEEASALANMSPTAFCRFFKNSTGKTLVNYLNEIRLGNACELLIENELTISEICYEVGFNNVSNFNRRFLEYHKISPKAYRKEFAKFDKFGHVYET